MPIAPGPTYRRRVIAAIALLRTSRQSVSAEVVRPDGPPPYAAFPQHRLHTFHHRRGSGDGITNHRRVDATDPLGPASRHSLAVGERVDRFQPDCLFRLVEYVAKDNLFLGCVGTKEDDVAFLAGIDEVLHHAAKWGDADSAGDEHERDGRVSGKHEIAGTLGGDDQDARLREKRNRAADQRKDERCDHRRLETALTNASLESVAPEMKLTLALSAWTASCTR